MLWALLATFLTRQPSAVQASVVGLCSGLFVTAATEANDRDTKIGSTILLILVVGALVGGLFYAGLRGGHVGSHPASLPPLWVSISYVAVWVLSLLDALLSLFGNGGLKVAVLAIVPLVLLGPT